MEPFTQGAGIEYEKTFWYNNIVLQSYSIDVINMSLSFIRHQYIIQNLNILLKIMIINLIKYLYLYIYQTHMMNSTDMK